MPEGLVHYLLLIHPELRFAKYGCLCPLARKYFAVCQEYPTHIFSHLFDLPFYGSDFKNAGLKNPVFFEFKVGPQICCRGLKQRILHSSQNRLPLVMVFLLCAHNFIKF